MKHIFRTILGKIFLFLVTAGFLTITVVSIVGTYMMLDCDIYRYTLEKKLDNYAEKAYFLRLYHLDTEAIDTAVTLTKIAYRIRYVIIPTGLLCGMISVICFVILMRVAGRRRGRDDLVVGPFYRIPLEIVAIFFIVPNYWFYRVVNKTVSDVVILLGLAAIFLAVCSFLIFSYMAAVRIKGHTLLKNTLLYRNIWLSNPVLKSIISFPEELISYFPKIWRKFAVILAVVIFEFILAFVSFSWKIQIWVILHVICLILGCKMVIGFYKLKKAGEELVNGNSDYKVDLNNMLPEFKTCGENLNHISEGISIAVDEKTRSERMKTELITNVSHDIKTPLTSIINYADLIVKESSDNENIVQYAEVLARQSNKLKRLIEDLVEASKAATGNLSVSMIKCKANVFLTQTAGEYEDRLARSNLSLILKGTDIQAEIMADGRRMLRVFDNLMNNICKYAMSETRVYLILEEQEDWVCFTFKNISRTELDLKPEELMERFVRGDKSRHTDGNGLGLAIAKSLTELQNGTLTLDIDGDLFKVILKFPSMN